MKKQIQRLGVAALLLAGLAVQAQSQGQGQGQPPGGQGGEHRGPPPEALAACKSLKAGAECSFTGRDRTVKGTCFAPENKPLACRPKDMGDRPQGQPPK